MNQDQLAELKALVGRIERIPKQNTVIIGLFMALLAGWNIWCQSRPGPSRQELIEAQAEIVRYREERKKEHAERQKQIDELKKIADDLRVENAEFRRIQAMQAEDPKRLGMIDAQHEAIRRYERTRTTKGRSDQ